MMQTVEWIASPICVEENTLCIVVDAKKVLRLRPAA
jgi:hypothetical protein